MAEPYRILTLNQISSVGLKRFPAARYTVGSEITDPDAILVRSQDMHEMDIPASVRAIGRAGAGTNNIPVEKMSQRGVPVFNAPGANANAVKELVIAGDAAGGAQHGAGIAFRRRTQGRRRGAAQAGGRRQEAFLPASNCRGARSA